MPLLTVGKVGKYLRFAAPPCTILMSSNAAHSHHTYSIIPYLRHITKRVPNDNYSRLCCMSNAACKCKYLDVVREESVGVHVVS